MTAMNDAILFYPPRRLGLAFQSILILLLTALGSWGFWQAAQSSVGPVLLLYLLPALMAMGLAPWIGYRAYASYRSFYALERDGIRLQWGWRMEDIPMDAVSEVRRIDELSYPLPLPFPRWPGAVAGQRSLPDGGQVEFMAVNTQNIILIATAKRSYAISPADPQQFMRAFRQLAELGSLTPIAARSVYPSFLLARVWGERAARFLLISGFVLGLLVLIIVSLIVPTRRTIPFGLLPDGSPRDLIPAVQLLLLPVMNAFFYLTNFFLGLFLHRRGGRSEADSTVWRMLAYLLWSCGVLTGLAFLAAVIFMVSSG